MSSRPTSNERDRFYEEYYRLWSMLATFYDPEGTDAEMTLEYVERCDPNVLGEILTSGQRFLKQHELPMYLISSTANRWLPTEAEERQWLQTLLDRVQAELEARRLAQDQKRA